MRRIPSPNDEHDQAFDACISNFLEPATILLYQNAKQCIMSAGTDFLQRINNGQLSTLLPSTQINGVEMKVAMTALYNHKLVKKGQPGRTYYDKWRALAPNGKCPLCDVKQVSTLDHYLSKSQFPILAIFPFNLIPACRDCNTEKLAHIASQYSEETLHPYFDDINQHQWLFATINQTTPTTFSFQVLASPGWSAELTQRVLKHMEVFKLDELFSAHAAEELTNISFRLRKLLIAGGTAAVRGHLFDCMESCMEANLNSWRTAIYHSMFNDVWFHANGF